MTTAADVLDVRRRPRWVRVLELVATALALAVLVRLLSRADLLGAWALLADAGPKAVLVLVPFALAMAVDALAHRFLLVSLGNKPAFMPLYLVRLAVEAVSISLPAGALFAETANPLLLKQRCGVPYTTGIVSNAAKRWLTMLSQSAYVALSALVGYGALSHVSRAFGLGRALPFGVLVAAALLLSASLVIGAVFSDRPWAARGSASLRSLPIRRLRVWLDSRQRDFTALDARVTKLVRTPRALWLPALLLFVGWLLESVDAFVILRVLGAPLGFRDVIAFEAGLALVRHLVFFLPAGLGIQDLGYVAFLGALGLPRATLFAAAFVVLKRVKEAAWIALGYLLLFALRFAPKSASIATEPVP